MVLSLLRRCYWLQPIWFFWALLWYLCSGNLGELNGGGDVLTAQINTLPGVIYASVLTVAWKFVFQVSSGCTFRGVVIMLITSTTSQMCRCRHKHIQRARSLILFWHISTMGMLSWTDTSWWSFSKSHGIFKGTNFYTEVACPRYKPILTDWFPLKRTYTLKEQYQISYLFY